MKDLHMTTAPRLAMKRNEAGELVANINDVTGEQDVNVAGKLIAIKPAPITYTRADNTEGVAYQGSSSIMDDNGNETTVSVLINESAIEEVVVGQVYWLNERLSKDGLYSNYSQGSLLVQNAIDASVATNRRAKLLALQAKATPAVADVEQA